MPKSIIVRIGYQDYAVTPADFADLTGITIRLRRVHRPDYTKPYVLDPEDADETFISHVQFENCDLTPLQPKAALKSEEAE